MRKTVLGGIVGAVLALAAAFLFFPPGSEAFAADELDQCECSRRCARQGSASGCVRLCKCGALECVTLVSESGAAVSCK